MTGEFVWFILFSCPFLPVSRLSCEATPERGHFSDDTLLCALVCFPDGEGQCFAWGCFVWQDRCGANPAGCRWEVGSTLVYTACQGWDCFSLASLEGDFFWLHLNPMYVCLHWLQMYELFMNSWIKWLWMKNVGRAAGSIRCPGIWPSSRLTWKCSLHWSTWCAFLGIDVNIKDNRGLTALDTVQELPSQKSQQIAALIEGISPSPCRGDQRTHWPNQDICIWCSFFLFVCFPCRSHDWKKKCKRGR